MPSAGTSLPTAGLSTVSIFSARHHTAIPEECIQWKLIRHRWKGLLRTSSHLKRYFCSYITSDCGAVDNVFDAHHYTATPEDTCNATLAAGMDIACGTFLRDHALKAVAQGKLAESSIDRALRNLIKVGMQVHKVGCCELSRLLRGRHPRKGQPGLPQLSEKSSYQSGLPCHEQAATFRASEVSVMIRYSVW
jgi:beta-glucosidase-like glycosyl hydrolase